MLRCGIVGLPNVGKSTLFNALTSLGVNASNYPFCTIEPNIGTVTVPDPALNALNQLVNTERVIPSVIEFVDIAGLVKGAAQGEGLGNQFLGQLREVDALIHVVRCFDDPRIVHAEGTALNVVENIGIIETELILSDLESVQKQHEKTLIACKRDRNNIEYQQRKLLLEKLIAHLNDAQPARTLACSAEEQLMLKSFFLITAKHMMYLANLPDGTAAEDNSHYQQLYKFASDCATPLISLCAQLEAELIQLDPETRQSFLEELELEQTSGLDKVIYSSYQLLKLHTFFTVGPKEIRAWVIPENTTAPQAAGKIHTDFEKGFIRAEVIHYDDFITYGGAAGAKKAGKLRIESREYIVHDRDILLFRYAV